MSTSVSVAAPPAAPTAGRSRLERPVRVLSAVSLAGALAGLVVGGVGGRLAMLLLARLNPEAAGTVSDDGFVMGQFGLLGTLNLLAVGVGLGLLGAGIYAVLRGLMVGPRWFQVLSISVGPAVVVGEMLVHTDGVDFRLLRPVELAIGLFVLLPGLYAAALTVLSERWLRPGSWFWRARPSRVGAVLLVWLLAFPLLPLLVVGAAGWWLRDTVRRAPSAARALSWPGWAWAARGVLTVVFVLSSLRLADDIAVLT